jgi:hypothetical protein
MALAIKVYFLFTDGIYDGIGRGIINRGINGPSLPGIMQGIRSDGRSAQHGIDL